MVDRDAGMRLDLSSWPNSNAHIADGRTKFLHSRRVSANVARTGSLTKIATAIRVASGINLRLIAMEREPGFQFGGAPRSLSQPKATKIELGRHPIPFMTRGFNGELYAGGKKLGDVVSFTIEYDLDPQS